MAESEITAAIEELHKTINELRGTIEFMDALSQEGFSQILTIANLALIRFESPDCYQHLENIINAFETIKGRAEQMQECVGYEAERAGANYVNEARNRRLAAIQHARESGAGLFP